ncbi:MAG: SDR family oxidoreductase [Rhodobacteraceae bacterium]|nr:SDR family oxidoreductase [Paracoccaceae bacterium]
MKILLIGHRGYIGPVAAQHLARALPGAEVHGIDANWFKGSEASGFPEAAFASQRQADVRDLGPADFAGFDAVVALAAVSNDPIGKEFEDATADINSAAVLKAATAARDAGVKRFVFASSCSMYGAGSDSFRKETDTLNPLTAYAKSKVATEEGLAPLATGDFMVTSLRFATACGASPMLRLDLVLNDFVATALRTGKIEVLSDGSPWRPLIHVEDMARAIEWGVSRTGDKFVAVNVGSQAWTWQVGQLARDVAEVLGGVAVEINTAAQPDKRSYRVDFSRFQALAPNHQPQKDFATAVRELAEEVRAIDFAGAQVRESRFIRLNILRGHVSAGRLDGALRWV